MISKLSLISFTRPWYRFYNQTWLYIPQEIFVLICCQPHIVVDHTSFRQLTKSDSTSWHILLILQIETASRWSKTSTIIEKKMIERVCTQNERRDMFYLETEKVRLHSEFTHAQDWWEISDLDFAKINGCFWNNSVQTCMSPTIILDWQ